MRLVAKYGDKSWIRVSRELVSRSDVQCRYRYLQLQRDGRAAGVKMASGCLSPRDVPRPQPDFDTLAGDDLREAMMPRDDPLGFIAWESMNWFGEF
jgi:hypothetical protein